MPTYQCFTDGDRTVISEVHDFTLLHMHGQGLMPNGDKFEAENWLEAKAIITGKVSELQQKMLGVSALSPSAREMIRREYDLWKTGAGGAGNTQAQVPGHGKGE